MGRGGGQVGASLSSSSARAACVPGVARGFRGHRFQVCQEEIQSFGGSGLWPGSVNAPLLFKLVFRQWGLSLCYDHFHRSSCCLSYTVAV